MPDDPTREIFQSIERTAQDCLPSGYGIWLDTAEHRVVISNAERQRVCSCSIIPWSDRYAKLTQAAFGAVQWTIMRKMEIVAAIIEVLEEFDGG